jgi:shikimate dehydrogenase
MKYGLIGKRLSHSYSKIIHGFIGNDEYELMEIPPDRLDAFLKEAAFTGINVTIPYKEAVLPYCVPDESAMKIGSVNTVINRDGVLYGYNTDYFGFSRMAALADVSFKNKKVVILGSGGTSKTAARVAGDEGAREIIIASRGAEAEVTQPLHCSPTLCSYDNLSRHGDCDVLVNTTPVGMYPNNSDTPVDLSMFTTLSAVLDVIYNPLRTKLILAARERGINASGGLAMLTAQAAMAHQLFFNGEVTALDALIAKTEVHFSNVVLVGMPGCGKSTLGKELAVKLNKDFTDTDALIEAKTGRSIPDIITDDGEAAFRNIERGVVADISKRAGQVIATGGGSVLLNENRDALMQNGTIVFVERELDRLATDGRPLSVNVAELYRTRRPIYESVSDIKFKIDESKSVEQNIGQLLSEPLSCGRSSRLLI